MNGGEEERIRVLVVGDSPLARGGLEAALLHSDRFEVVGACSLAASGALLEATSADAVLVESRSFPAWTAPEAGEAEPAAKPPRAPLTPREMEVLRWLADGASNKIIAHGLGISEHTVKFHVASVLSKLNAGTRAEAVMLGVRSGILYL